MTSRCTQHSYSPTSLIDLCVLSLLHTRLMFSSFYLTSSFYTFDLFSPHTISKWFSSSFVGTLCNQSKNSVLSEGTKHVWLDVEFPHSGGQTVGVIVGGLALLAMILVGISCHRKRARKRKLNALLAKRYGNTFHFFKTLSRIS